MARVDEDAIRSSRLTGAGRLTGEQITVYVADDHPAIRESLSRAIGARAELRLAGQAGEGRGALAEIRALAPYVAVLDLNMPGLGGVQVLEALRRDAATTRVLLLTGYADSDAVYRAIAAGASGCLGKTAGTPAICDAITAVARGEMVVSPEFHAGLAREIRLRAADARPLLSEREREVLTLTAEGATAAGIGSTLHLSPATVRTHLQHLYAKLGVADRAAAVAKAIRRGLID